METLLERTNNISYNEKQLDDAKQFCSILQAVPADRRDVFITVANAYMDGMAAGEAIASGKNK